MTIANCAFLIRGWNLKSLFKSTNGFETKRFFLYTFLLSASSPLSAVGASAKPVEECKFLYSSCDIIWDKGTVLALFKSLWLYCKLKKTNLLIVFLLFVNQMTCEMCWFIIIWRVILRTCLSQTFMSSKAKD